MPEEEGGGGLLAHGGWLNVPCPSQSDCVWLQLCSSSLFSVQSVWTAAFFGVLGYH